MFLLTCLCLVLINLLQTQCSNTKGRVNQKSDGKDHNKITFENDYQRHIIEDGVKSPIFGSNSYDPIKQIFEASMPSPGKASTTPDIEEENATFLNPTESETHTDKRKHLASAEETTTSRRTTTTSRRTTTTSRRTTTTSRRTTTTKTTTSTKNSTTTEATSPLTSTFDLTTLEGDTTTAWWSKFKFRGNEQQEEAIL